MNRQNISIRQARFHRNRTLQNEAKGVIYPIRSVSFTSREEAIYSNMNGYCPKNQFIWRR